MGRVCKGVLRLFRNLVGGLPGVGNAAGVLVANVVRVYFLRACLVLACTIRKCDWQVVVISLSITDTACPLPRISFILACIIKGLTKQAVVITMVSGKVSKRVLTAT